MSYVEMKNREELKEGQRRLPAFSQGGTNVIHLSTFGLVDGLQETAL